MSSSPLREADLHIPLPDEGTFAADLRGLLRSSFALARIPQVTDLLRALMAEAQLDPAFAERFRAQFLQRRRRALGTLLERARARGELPNGVSVETVTDVVFGVLWYRLLAIPAPLDHTLADELVALLAPGTERPTGREDKTQ